VGAGLEGCAAGPGCGPVTVVYGGLRSCSRHALDLFGPRPAVASRRWLWTL
jgi:hypothetical protein